MPLAKPVACAKADCGSGCCGAKAAVAPPPDAPATAPAPKSPPKPVKKAHRCERPPSDAREKERLDLAALPVGIPKTLVQILAVTSVVRPCVTPRAASPPLTS